MLKRGSVSWAIWNIVEAILFVVGGALCCANSKNTDFQGTFILIVAIVVIVDASIRLLFDVFNAVKIKNLTVVKTSYGQAVTGALELAIGIILILVSNSVKNGTTEAQIIFKSIGLILGILALVAGAVILVYAIIFLAKKVNGILNNVLLICGAALVIALGVLILVFFTKQENILTLFFIVFGVAMILVGVLGAFACILFLVERSHAKKAAKSEPQEDKAIENGEENK